VGVNAYLCYIFFGKHKIWAIWQCHHLCGHQETLQLSTFRRKLHLHTYICDVDKDVRRRGWWLEESKVALQIKKFLTQLEIFATNELQKEFPEIGIYI